MAARNTWILPAAVLMMIGVLAAAVFGGAAVSLGTGPQQATSSILTVPGKYATIQAAIDAAQPGDIIQVAPGTYNENIMLNKAVSLTASAFDQVNAANNTTVIDGGHGQATVLIPAGLSQMPSLHGFVIRNSTVGIEAHSPFDAENNYFYGSQMSVEYQAGSGGTNRDNVYFNSADDAVHMDDITMPLLLEGNRFMYAGDDSIEINFPSTSAPNSPVEVDIYSNMIIGSTQDGIKFVDFATSPRDANRRVVVAGNLIANNQRAGIGVMHSGNTNEDYSGVGAAEAIRVYNDTFYGNDYGISGGANLVAFNNIIANSTARGAWRVQGAADDNSVIAYTLFSGNRVDTDQSLVGPGDISGPNPLFVAPPGPGPDGAWGTVDDDFRGLVLQPGSPAVDRGVVQYRTASGELVPPAPLTGWTGAAPDLGWKELGSSFFLGTVTPIPTATAALAATATLTPQPTAAATTATAAATSTGKPGGTQTPGTPLTGTPPSPTAASGTPQATATGLPLFIQSVSPSSAGRNQQLTLTITGSGFKSGATVSFEGLPESPPQVMAVQIVNDTTMQVTVNTADDGLATDVWDIRVTNADGSAARLLQAFTITP